MTSNFLLNNFLTYRDQRLQGFAILRGLLLFYLVCSVGLLANVGVAFSVYDQEPIWWLAGAAGAPVGGGWDFGIFPLFVSGEPKKVFYNRKNAARPHNGP